MSTPQAQQPVVTFNTDEQSQLQSLNTNAAIWKMLFELLSEGSFKGAHSNNVLKGLETTQSLYNQTMQQISSIEKIASDRAANPLRPSTEATDDKKANKKPLKSLKP